MSTPTRPRRSSTTFPTPSSSSSPSPSGAAPSCEPRPGSPPAPSLASPGAHGCPVREPPAGAIPCVARWGRRAAERCRLPTGGWAAIGDLPALARGEGNDVAAYGRAPSTPYQRLMRGDQEALFNHVAPALEEKMITRISHVPEGGNWRDIPRRLLPAGMKRARKSDHTNRYGRLTKRGLCCTILAKGDPHGGSYGHPEDDRALTAREPARLQPFPDHVRFLGPRSPQ